MGPGQPIQWALETTFHGIKWPFVKLTTHLYLRKRLRIVQLYPSLHRVVPIWLYREEIITLPLISVHLR